MKKLNPETLDFFRTAGRQGGLARNPRKKTASLENLKKAREKRWSGKDRK
jgi:hypothetical protein